MKRLRFRLESQQPGRFDLTLSVYGDFRPEVGLSPCWRHATVYLAFLPVVREWHGARGYRWRRAWIFGRRGRAIHLGPVGFLRSWK